MELSATELLRREHRQMERRLEPFEAAQNNPQGKGLLALAETFARIQEHLAAHFRKEGEEENGLLAFADRYLDGTSQARLAEQMLA